MIPRVFSIAMLLLPALLFGEHPVPWMREGIIASSDMEALTFVLRRGGAPEHAAEEWRAARSETAVRKLKEAGVNFAIINFHKGAGLQAEAEDIEVARKFTEIAHRYGIRVAGYVGSSMMYETLYLEEPDAPDWRQVDEFGNPIYYTADQTFRYMACRNNPGYQAFIRKVVRMGIESLKLDAIHFDQMQWWSEPRSCRCSYCRAQFREFLGARYADPMRARLRFGFTRFDQVIPPPYGLPEPPVRLAELRNPMMQEWAQFRAWSLARRFEEWDRYIHELNPQAAMIGNPTMNLEANNGFIYGVDPEQLFDTADGIWTEEPNLPEWTVDGRLVSQIRSYKAARTMGKTLFHWQDLIGYSEYQRAPLVLRFAEALAYGDANLGVIAGGDARAGDVPAVTRQAVKFFQTHLKDLIQTTEVADVAILRSFPSVAFNPAQGNFSTVLFEQTLIQSKIPFAIIFNKHLKDLGKYKVLVLADQDALSNEEVKLIHGFVEHGGGLVATGNTSTLTEWRTHRAKPALADLFGADAVPSRPVQRSFGKGRVAYIPAIEAAMPPPTAQMNYAVRNSLWKLPRNNDELVSAVRWAIQGELSLDVSAPEWVTAELAEQSSSHTRLVHLVNFLFEKPVHSIPVRIRIPRGLRVREAVLDAPDGQPAPLEISTRGGDVFFQVPELKAYALILVRMDGH